MQCPLVSTSHQSRSSVQEQQSHMAEGSVFRKGGAGCRFSEKWYTTDSGQNHSCPFQTLSRISPCHLSASWDQAWSLGSRDLNHVYVQMKHSERAASLWHRSLNLQGKLFGPQCQSAWFSLWCKKKMDIVKSSPKSGRDGNISSVLSAQDLRDGPSCALWTGVPVPCSLWLWITVLVLHLAS